MFTALGWYSQETDSQLEICRQEVPNRGTLMEQHFLKGNEMSRITGQREKLELRFCFMGTSQSYRSPESEWHIWVILTWGKRIRPSRPLH